MSISSAAEDIASEVSEVSEVSGPSEGSSAAFFFYSQHSGLPHCGMPEYISSDFVARAARNDSGWDRGKYCDGKSMCV